MNTQEAYNKGLSDSETKSLDLLGGALAGVDDRKFDNPNMEKLRQIILAKSKQPASEELPDQPDEDQGEDQPNPPTRSNDYAIPMLLGNPVGTNDLTSAEKIVVDILGEVRSIVDSNSKNKISSQLRSLVRSLEVDIIKTKSKS